MSLHRILVVNLGGSSSKFAVYSGETLIAQQSLSLADAEQQLPAADQRELRTLQLGSFLSKNGLTPESFAAVASRGGLTRPLPEYGAYLADAQMLADLAAERFGSHPANLSALVASDLLSAAGSHSPVYVVDPVSIDTLWPRARLSGVNGILRSGRHHALNVHAAMRTAARLLGQPLHRLRLVVAHFGSGVSICSVEGGRVVDANNALLGEGPFSVSRAGNLALEASLDLALSGRSRAELEQKLTRASGLAGYTGTSDFAEIERRIDAGGHEAREAYEAMVFQSAKYIAAAAGALGQRPDAIVLTGGLLRSARFAAGLHSQVEWICRVIELPGEDEMNALAHGALAVLRGEQPALSYADAADPLNAPPRNFEELLAKAAAGPPCTFIVAGAEQPGVAESAALCRQHGLGNFILLGDLPRINSQLLEAGSPAGIEVIDSAAVVADALALAASQPRSVLVKGSCDSAQLLRGVLETLSHESRPFLSHVAMIENPYNGHLLALSDGGLNVSPDLEQKVQIMQNAAGLLWSIGHRRPGVLLAAGMEDKGQKASAVADAREILKRHHAGEWPGMLIDGPFGLDVAFSAEAASSKGIRSPLSGRADLVLCPDLEACNFAVKMATLYGQGRWAGVVVGGQYPIVIGSRADDPQSRLASLALASLAANNIHPADRSLTLLTAPLTRGTSRVTPGY